MASSTGGASPALARKLREAIAEAPALEWADLANVLSKARKQIKKRGVAVDPQRWQCCRTPDLLSLAQAGKDEQALEQIMSTLLNENAPGLCSDVKKCRSEGCST